MGTTPRGLVYPESGGHTRTWEHWQNLATSADTAIGDALAGVVSSSSWVPTFGGVACTIDSALRADIGPLTLFQLDARMNGAPTGPVTVTLPAPADVGDLTGSVMTAALHMKDVSAGQYFHGYLVADGAASVSVCRLMLPVSGTNTLSAQVGPTAPTAWAVNDAISIRGFLWRA